MEDFHNAVIFLQETSNPVMDTWSEEERQNSKYLLEKECRILLTEIDRLKRNRDMQDKRLKNVMGLVYSFPSLLASILRLHIQAFSSVNAEDSRHMACLTEISLRDSAAMKQISYLTMVFLPASFAAASAFLLMLSVPETLKKASVRLYLV